MFKVEKSTSRWPTISVVTPSYNQGNYLERTMLSVLNQNYPKLEYVVIDGGSSDGSKKIIQKYASKLKYWQSKRDGGQSDAINQGFAHTFGDVMCWINSDDILMPGALRMVGSIFANLKDVEWINSLPTTITPDNFINYVALKPWYVRSFLQRGWYIRKLLGFVMQEGTFWRRSLWEKAGGYIKDVPYSMDWELWKRFAQHSDLVLVNAVLAAYRLNPERKNNDEHKNYYQEIGMDYPDLISLPIKYAWRKTANIAHALQIPKLISYDESSSSWYFRRSRGQISCFKLLGQ